MRKIIGFIKKFLGITYYVSPLDNFLKTYDQAHPKLSLSERQEKEKYERIHYLRDNKVIEKPKKILWDKF